MMGDLGHEKGSLGIRAEEGRGYTLRVEAGATCVLCFDITRTEDRALRRTTYNSHTLHLRYISRSSLHLSTSVYISGICDFHSERGGNSTRIGNIPDEFDDEGSTPFTLFSFVHIGRFSEKLSEKIHHGSSDESSASFLGVVFGAGREWDGDEREQSQK